MNYDCSIEKCLNVIGGKWSFLVLRELFCGKKRFGELKNSIHDISSKSLTQTLRHLEATGIIVREAYATIPPTVEYELTEKGHTLHTIIHEMKKWGAHWA
ncbi:winged helix-turn-helix transcriptional regulator [Paenibacillus allorhizosphaerae]|uniref:HTH-type transcriptional regulator YybR n=1 Tax=Paenibacillus allorhizosphaerae TaxID=2849866 RepID=A0ABM8VR98_9BACL|nr:helix-turn-helix domain-containing protein [Paenibacillus allorhizosphaerae]CAG7655031.1 putative HTH-type transcriptional regulator YybR [Paenibacillus allorhizosphaerae]